MGRAHKRCEQKKQATKKKHHVGQCIASQHMIQENCTNDIHSTASSVAMEVTQKDLTVEIETRNDSTITVDSLHSGIV